MKKIIIALCLVLSLTMLVCSCETGDNTDGTTPAEITTKAPDDNGSNPTSGTTTAAQTTTAAPNNNNTPTTVTYTVKVIDETGAPVAGAAVQLCLGDLCKMPALTGADGVASFNYEPDNYKALVTIEGYNCGDYVFFAEGSTELTITITKLPA